MIEVVAVLASILVLAALAAWAGSWAIGSLKDHGRVEAERDHAQEAGVDATKQLERQTRALPDDRAWLARLRRAAARLDRLQGREGGAGRDPGADRRGDPG